MNIYLLQQDIITGYDTYDSAVVCAEDEDDARTIHPSAYVTHHNNDKWMGTYGGGANTGKEYDHDDGGDWPRFSRRNEIMVTLIGIADRTVKRGVVCASFNAG